MLQLILGRAGSGKTGWLRDEIAEKVRSGEESLILLVPEQVSFQNERALLGLLGPALARRVEVLSFTRLTDRIQREAGGGAGRRLQDSGRCMLMTAALEQVKDELCFYRRSTGSPDFIKAVLQLSGECKQNAILPAALEAMADGMEEGSLKEKTRELSLILGSYEALVASSFVDPLDDLTRLASLLAEYPFFEGKQVFLDGFTGFTGQEWAILKRILAQAALVTVTLCADSLDEKGGPGLFAPVTETGRRLIGLAKEQGRQVAVPVTLTKPLRYQSGALAKVERELFRFTPGEEAEEEDSLWLFEAANPQEEAQFVARTARYLARVKGYRYRQMAVIARTAQPYEDVLEAASSQNEVPLFLDRREQIDAKPLTAAVLTALEAVSGNFETDALLRYAKTGFAGLSLDEISQLENYVLLWGIDRRRWLGDWQGNPQGFAEQFSDGAKETLSQINRSRAHLIEPLLHLEQAAQDADGEGMAKAVYGLLEETGAAYQLKSLVTLLREEGRNQLADEQAALWELLMAILDQAALTLKGTRLSLRRFLDTLRLVFSTCDLGLIPQGLDEVQFGAADRIRPNEPKVTFLIGANDGEFPQNRSPGGLLTDFDRSRLIAMGLPLSQSVEQQAQEERFLAYTAAASPSELLIVSYKRQNAVGDALLPSVLVGELRRMFPTLATQVSELAPSLAQAVRPAFELTALTFREPTVLSASLKALFATRPGYRRRLAALERAAARRPFAFAGREAAARLFGSKMTLSATKIEKYHLCRFAYFCRYGLHAKPRKKAEFNALEYGTAIHFLLERLLRIHSPAQLNEQPPASLQREIDELLEEYVTTRLGGWEDKTPRFRYLFSRLSRTARTLVLHLVAELCQSEFVPTDFELAIGEGGDLAPMTLRLPGGGEVQVEGKIDRLDVMHKNGKSYVRVVDYKTGTKVFQLSDVLFGLNMQMLLYLITVWQNGKDRYGDVVPAGILYMPSQDAPVEADRHADEAAVQKEKGKQFKMNGLLLDDKQVIVGMEPGAAGLFIPAKLTKSGELDSRSSVASLSQFGRLAAQMEELLTRMAQTLLEGDVAAVPAAGEYDACAWCDYKTVCGHERGDPVRFVEKIDRVQVLEALADKEVQP